MLENCHQTVILPKFQVNVDLEVGREFFKYSLGYAVLYAFLLSLSIFATPKISYIRPYDAHYIPAMVQQDQPSLSVTYV